MRSVSLAEWLRRQPAKLMGFPRAGSNPAADVFDGIFVGPCSYSTVVVRLTRNEKVAGSIPAGSNNNTARALIAQR